MKKVSGCRITAIVLAGAVASTSHAAGYKLTKMGTFMPYGMNNAGDVVGGLLDGPNAALYSNGTLTNLGTFGGESAALLSINNAGQIAGLEYKQNLEEVPIVVNGGVATILQPLGLSSSGSAAYGINDSGQVVGSTVVGAEYHAFLYDLNTGVGIDLGDLGSPGSSAMAINASGQVVGTSTVSPFPGSFDTHAFIYSNGTMTDMGTLPGLSECEAVAINAQGQATGDCRTFSVQVSSTGFLYSHGQLTTLGSIGQAYSVGSAINSSSQIVGTVWDASFATHAFISLNGAMANLDTLDRADPLGRTLKLDGAHAINDSGVIVATAYDANAHFEDAYLLTPVNPAPTRLTAQAGNGSVQLSWKAPADASGTPLTYNVYEGTSSGGESPTPVMTGITGTTAAIGNLTNRQTYYFEVRATSIVGTSAASLEAHATPRR